MELWLKDKGFEPEPVTPSAERVFEYGDVIEKLVFDDIEWGDRQLGSWYSRSRVLEDPVTGLKIYPNSPSHAQKEVAVGPFKGHIDRLDYALVEYPGEQPRQVWVLLDSKSANKMSFMGASKGVLTGHVFSREYVVQMQLYMKGLQLLDFHVFLAGLIYSDKEKGGLMVRFIPFDAELAEEGLQRLLRATEKAEPEPDHEWVRGMEIPLRCGYCDMKWQCATIRNQRIEGPVYTPRGAPKWLVMS